MYLWGVSRVGSLLVVVCVMLLIFLLNFILPSDLNNWSTGLNFSFTALENDSILRKESIWRYTDSEFGRRPLMVNLLRYTTEWVGWSYTFSFLFWQVVGYLIALGALYWTSTAIWERRWSPALVALPFMLVFPNVFLFVAHAHTYNDLYQYAAIFLSLGLGFQSRAVAACLAIAASCIVRETSVIFLPLYSLLFYYRATSQRWLKVLTPWIALGVACVVIYAYASPLLLSTSLDFTLDTRVYAYRDNLSSWARISEAIWLPIFILLPAYLALRPLRVARQRDAGVWVLVRSFPYVAVLNTLTVWFLAKADEPRLFLLPLLIILPILPVALSMIRSALRHSSLRWQLTDYIKAACVVIAVQLLYHPSVGGTGYAFRAYALVWTLAMVVLWRSTQLTPSRSISR